MSAAADMERGGLVETGDEYLVSHGSSGGVGRFAAEPGLCCQRGDRVVVESRRGLGCSGSRSR